MTIRALRRYRLLLPLCALAALGLLAPATTSSFAARVVGSTNSAASNPYFSCASAFTAYSQTSTYFEYPLTESSSATYAADDSGSTTRRGTYRGSMTSSSTTPMACDGTAGGAYVLNGSTSYISTPTAVTNPTTFTLSVWFKTTAAQGALIGFGDTASGAANNYDRVIYLDTSGHLVYGIYGSSIQALTSTKTYTDGTWHLVTATQSASTGMVLYVDGSSVGSNTTYTTPGNYSGYWRIGYDTLTGAPNAPTSFYFKGSLRYAAAYRTALAASEVTAMYVAGS